MPEKKTPGSHVMDEHDDDHSGSEKSHRPSSKDEHGAKPNDSRVGHRRVQLPTMKGVDVALSKAIRKKILNAVTKNDFSSTNQPLSSRQLSTCLLSNDKDYKDYADIFLLIDSDSGASIIEAFCEDKDFKIEGLRHAESNLNALQYALEYNKWSSARAVLQLVRPDFIVATCLKNQDSHEVETCLHRLVCCGQEQLTTLLLAKLADYSDRFGYVTRNTLVHEWGERLRVSALHLAALGGHLDIVQHLVQEEQVPADLRTNNMATAAFLAIRKGHVAVAQWLVALEKSQTVLADRAGLNFLHYAVLSDSEEAVNFVLSLLRSGLRLSPLGQEDNPLLLAARRGNVEVVRSLLGCPEISALLNSRSKAKGNTPLHTACMGRTGGDTAVASLLLAAGAEIRSFNKHRETPIMLAAQSGNADTLIAICAEFARRTSADENPRAHRVLFDDISEDGKTVWHYAIETSDGEAEPAESIVRALIEFSNLCSGSESSDGALKSSDDGGDLVDGRTQTLNPQIDVLDYLYEKPTYSPQQPQGYPMVQLKGSANENRIATSTPPLHIAASIGSMEKLKVLLLPAYLHRYNFFDSNKNTFLHSAAYNSQTKVLLCYATPTSLNQENADGDTPLHIASREGQFDCVQQLLPMANLKLANKQGALLLHELCGRSDVTAEILNETVQRMRDVSWDLLYHCDNKGRTALHILSGISLSSSAEKIFTVFTKTTLTREQDLAGNMPIHTALLADRLDNLSALLKVFSDMIDVNVRNSDGETPLIIAVKMRQVQAVSMLLNNGADLIAADNEGNTALHTLVACAAKNSESTALYIEMMQLILDGAVRWHRHLKKLAPVQTRDSVRNGSPDVQYWQCFREAVLKLVVLARNDEGLNVIYLAAKLNTCEILRHLLQVKGAFVLSKGSRANDGPCYDVTDMVFNTLSVYNGYKASAVASSPKPDEVDSCEAPLLKKDTAAKLDEQRHMWLSRDRALVEVIVNNGFQDCWKLLDIPAIDKATTDYWIPYRWLYIASLILHMLYMVVLSYAGVYKDSELASLCHVTSTTNKSASSDGNSPSATPFTLVNTSANLSEIKSFSSEEDSFLTNPHDALISLIILAWPFGLLLRYGFLIAISLGKHAKNLKAMPLQLIGQSVLHPLTFMERATTLLIPMVFACIIVAYFALHLTRQCSQNYMLAIAILLGWVYTVHFTSGIAGLHHFTVILQRIVFRDLLRFAFVFLLLILGFSLAFLVIVRTATPVVAQLPSEGHAIFAVLRAWVGAGDIVDVTLLSSDYSRARSYLSVLFITYMIITTVVMTNMLIAMMNDSYHVIYTERKLVWRIDTLKTAHQLDRHYPFVGRMLRKMLGLDKKIWQETIFIDGHPLRRFVMPAES